MVRWSSASTALLRRILWCIGGVVMVCFLAYGILTACEPFPQCGQNADCTAPLICDTTRRKCVAQCTRDADCPSSQRCANLLCVGGSSADGGPSDDPTPTGLSPATLEYLKQLQQHIRFHTDAQGKTTSITIANQLHLDLSTQTVRIQNANLQIVNGDGKTASTNRLGNLILGYNEPATPGAQRLGSHNLIVGPAHEYLSYGGIVGGHDNQLSGPHASILGGSNNRASGEAASVAGGNQNNATSKWSCVLGGSGNTAGGQYTTVSGGQSNNTIGEYSHIAGGQGNTAQNNYSCISGGQSNRANGNYSSILGGNNLQTNGNHDTVLGNRQSGGACLTTAICP